MAELGESGNPRDLVAGDPDAVERNVTAIRDRGRSMELAGEDLKTIDSGAWEGAAGEAFRDKFTYEPGRWHKAADAFEATAKALEAYASTLRWAQSEAREAIHHWDQGEEATRAAKGKHDQAVANAESQNHANAAAGDPTVLQVAPFSDPGEAKRQAAREMLNRARQQLTEAGDRAANTIRARGDEAPETSTWDDIGEFFSDAGDFVGDFGVGAWDVISGTAEFLWDISPHHLITDIEAYGETWEELGSTVAAAAENPLEFGKQLIGWEHWKNGDPGRALGQIAGGALLGYGAGKAASSLNKLRKAREAPEVKGNPHDDIKTLEKGKNSHVRLVNNEQELRGLFDKWKEGAQELPSRGNKVPEVYELDDGTVIQWRTASRSGGATIDIISPTGNSMKVHVK